MSPKELPAVIARGGPGWRSNRPMAWVIGSFGLLLLIAAVAVATSEDVASPLAAGAVGLFMIVSGWLVGAGWPRPGGGARPYETVMDGEPMTVIPCRPVALPIVGLLVLLGAFLLIGGVVAGVIGLSDGNARAIAVLVMGPVLGIVLLVLGLANLRPKSRAPEPVLLAARGVGWMWAGRRQWTAWEDLGAIEPWWTKVGLGRPPLPRLRANLIVLRGRDGAPLVAIAVTLLATAPQEALHAMQRRWEAETGHAA